MKLFVSNLKDFYCVYAKEIHQIFSESPFRTENIAEADYIVTCLSDELNYPKYGNMDYARSVLDLKNIHQFTNIFFPQRQIKVIFCHIPTYHSNSIITVCYSKNNSDTHNIVVCPPAIVKYTFNERLDRKYLMSFKGNIWASKNRLDVFQVLQKYNNDKLVFVDKSDTHYDYNDLMENTLLSVIIEGDLPWTYRLTEAINAGCVPVIIKPRDNNIFAFDELIDYSLFSFVVNHDEIEKFMTEVFPKITYEQIKVMLEQLKIVNTKYFISREKQMEGVTEILEKRLSSHEQVVN